MTRTAGLALRVVVLAPALALLLVPPTPAFGGKKRWRDDQIPFGPEGTIGRGTDSAADPPYNVRGGIP